MNYFASELMFFVRQTYTIYVLGFVCVFRGQFNLYSMFVNCNMAY